MTREQLIKAIYFSDDMWSCPNCPCDLSEEENTSEYCWKCAERQLEEYEAKVRADAIEEFKKYLLKHKRLVRDLKTKYLYEATKIEFVLGETFERLKEEERMSDEELMRIAFADNRTVQEILRNIFNMGVQRGREDAINECEEIVSRETHDGTLFDYLEELKERKNE